MVLLRVIATCLISLLLSLAAPPSAPAALSPAAQSPAYAYDDAHIPSVTADAPAERGPPATYDQHTAYNAVDRWSYGASARREQPTRPGFYDYDGIAPVVQIASVAITTQEATRGSTGPLASFQRSEVAAKTLPEVKPNATVRDLLEIAPGNAREPLKSGLASRRTDQELLDSVMRPRDGTYMTVSRDGALLEGNHRRFELLDRARDPRSSIDWDTSIFLDGWPW